LNDDVFFLLLKPVACGNIKHDLTLNDREYICANCGIIIDRDLNAAINIEAKVLGVDSTIRAMSECQSFLT